ncbi:MAG: hypothetical protein GF335_00640 [Candidatus Moranbacteria bacterium]|nr:hypothetical protein [Candidatus Moranbacteria bacterium]
MKKNKASKNPFKDLNEFVEKVDEMKKKDKMDLSSDQDLSIAIMNLVSIEEHFFFTAVKTGKDDYYDLLAEVREIRKELLKKIIKDYEGEVWCISKHLLAASMRVMEVGTKLLGQGKKKQAKKLFQRSFDLYSLFWGVNMEIIDTGKIKKIGKFQINKHDKKNKSSTSKTKEVKKNSQKNKKQGITAKLGALVKKAIDCCIE